MTTPRAFLVMPPTMKMDMANLGDFGDPTALLDKGVRLFNPDASVDDILKALEEHEYNPALDVIVLTGPSVALVYLNLAVIRYISESFVDQTYLSVIYDGRAKRYQRCAIPLPVLVEN